MSSTIAKNIKKSSRKTTPAPAPAPTKAKAPAPKAKAPAPTKAKAPAPKAKKVKVAISNNDYSTMITKIAAESSVALFRYLAKSFLTRLENGELPPPDTKSKEYAEFFAQYTGVAGSKYASMKLVELKAEAQKLGYGGKDATKRFPRRDGDKKKQPSSEDYIYYLEHLDQLEKDAVPIKRKVASGKTRKPKTKGTKMTPLITNILRGVSV